MHHLSGLAKVIDEPQPQPVTLALRAGFHDVVAPDWHHAERTIPLTITSDNPRAPAIFRVPARGLHIGGEYLTIRGVEFRGETSTANMLTLGQEVTLRDNVFITKSGGKHFAINVVSPARLLNNRLRGMGLSVSQGEPWTVGVVRLEGNEFDVSSTAILVAGKSNPLITGNRVLRHGDGYVIAAYDDSTPRLEGQDVRSLAGHAALFAGDRARITVIGGQFQARASCMLLVAQAQVVLSGSTVGSCGADHWSIVLDNKASARISDSRFIVPAGQQITEQINIVGPASDRLELHNNSVGQ